MSKNNKNKKLTVKTVYLTPIRSEELGYLCGLLSLCDHNAHSDDMQCAARILMRGMGYETTKYWELNEWDCLGLGQNRLHMLFKDKHDNYIGIHDDGEDVLPYNVEWESLSLSPDEVADLKWRRAEDKMWVAFEDDTYYIAHEDPKRWLRVQEDEEHEDEEEDEYEEEEDDEEAEEEEDGEEEEENEEEND